MAALLEYGTAAIGSAIEWWRIVGFDQKVRIRRSLGYCNCLARYVRLVVMGFVRYSRNPRMLRFYQSYTPVDGQVVNGSPG